MLRNWISGCCVYICCSGCLAALSDVACKEFNTTWTCLPSATLAVQADSRSHEVAETDSGVLTTVVPVSCRLLCARALSVMTMQCITTYFELSCKSQLQLQTSSSWGQWEIRVNHKFVWEWSQCVSEKATRHGIGHLWVSFACIVSFLSILALTPWKSWELFT